MNKSTMAFTAVLTLTFLGALNEYRSVLLTPIKRWIDQPDLAEQEKASALRPVIACLNSVDSPWRHAYTRYLNRDRKTDPTLKERFPEDFGSMAALRERLDFVRNLDAYGCRLNLLQKNNLQKWAPLLLPLQNRLESSLLAANEAAQLFDFFNTVPAYPVSPAEKAQRDSVFLPLVDEYLKASDALRRQLDIEDLNVREVQLKQLKVRDELKYAHILTYMLEARTLMLKLDNHIREQTLSVDDLSDASKNLQLAWDNGTRYLQANPATSTADYPEKIWKHMRSPGESYLKAIEKLRDDWTAKASPQQLSDDFEIIGRRYDWLVGVYNEQVEPLF
ncbi:hypothetical protein ACYZUC_05380 [Pseudomonas sp. GT1P32]